MSVFVAPSDVIRRPTATAEERDMNVDEALGIAAHLRTHAMPEDGDESIEARRTKTVIALADAVESLRTRNERLGLARLEAESTLEKILRPAQAASLAWSDPSGVEERVRCWFDTEKHPLDRHFAVALDRLTESLDGTS